MSFFTSDRQTRNHLFGTTSLLTFSAVLFFCSLSEADAARQAHQKQASHLAQLEQQLQQAAKEQEEYAHLLPEFQKIIEKAEVKPSPPRARAEILLALQKELQLPALSYEFQPVVSLPGSLQAPTAFISQPLKIHLDLIHEADFLRFFEKLPQRTGGMFLIRHCQLARGLNPALTADCEIDWLTLTRTKP